MDIRISINYSITRFNGIFNYSVSTEVDSKEECLFMVKEYEGLDLEFLYESYVEEIYIETFDRGRVKYMPGQIIKINSNNSVEKLVPGYYEILIYTFDGRCYKKYFGIQPQNISQDALWKLRESLNDYQRGLAINYDIRRWGNNSYSNSVLADIEKYVMEWDEIKYILRGILQQPAYEIRKEYEYSNKLVKLDARVIRKLESKAANKEMHNRRYYQPTIKYNYNISDNYQLIVNIENYLKNFKMLYKNLNKAFLNVKIYLAKIEKEYQQIMAQINQATKKAFLSKNWVQNLRNRKNYLGYLINEAEDRQDKFEYIQKMLSSTINDIEEIIYVLEEKWDLQNRKFFSTSVVKEARYLSVIEKLNMLDNSNTQSSTNSTNNGFTFKRTELLFEYFCLVRVIHAVMKLGFYLEDENNNLYYLTEIPSETVFYYIKDNKRVVIQYDKEAPLETNADTEGLCSINSYHRRPDISLLLYEDDKFIRALVCEVKYRNHHYIYSNKGPTEVVETMKDYRQLAYLGEDIVTAAVEKVILMYPKQDTNIQCNERVYQKMFTFIPIDVSKKEIEQELIKEINDFIEK